jgi:hypothetical protein
MPRSTPRSAARSTPLFAGFHRRLFGAPPRGALQKLLPPEETLRGASQLRSACGDLVPDHLLPKAPSQANSRQRLFPPLVTFWAFLAQVLAGSSCREAVRGFLAHLPVRPLDALAACSANTAAYCRARARLPLAMLEKIFTALGTRLTSETPQDTLWCGRRVRIIDGSTASMPDTAENQTRWPQSSSQKPGCGFPTLRMVGLFCLHSGALLHRLHGGLKDSEQSMARQLWRCLDKEDVLLGDRGFCSYMDICQLLQRGVDVVLRLHAGRDRDFRKGQRLGRNDGLRTWPRPRRDRIVCTDEEYAALPATLTVRYVRAQETAPGFRSEEIVVVTTLLDSVRYPLLTLLDLYRRRWRIETHWGECKTTLRLDILRCLRPSMVEKELLLHAIAFNLVRALMQRAAITHHQPLERISFKGTLDTLNRFAAAMHAVAAQPRKHAAVLAHCLHVIAADPLPDRPDRVEPRAVKRRPKAYDKLQVPRHQTKAKKAARRQTRPAKPSLS